MWRISIYFAILHAAYGTCPSGFDIIHGECIGKYARLNEIRWVDAPSVAISKCKDIQGLPITIHNNEKNVYMANHYSSSRNPVLGLLCDANTKKWQWVDGSAVDYKPFKYYDGLDKPCAIGFSWEVSSDGSWSGSGNNTNTYDVDIFCQTMARTQPVPNEDGCDSFEDDSDDGVCYQVGAMAESWKYAQMICAKLGANLASIHNSQENSFIRRLAVSRGTINGIYLGATTSGKGNEFGWVDGSDWDYENFHSGFPMPGIGECVAMDTSSSAGQWMNIDCDSKLPAACIRSQKPVTDLTCSDGPWTEDTIITSPGFPFNASTPCDYFLSVETGKKVEVEIASLEANNCCDYLVIHDGFLGGEMIANLTGSIQNVTYTSSSNLMRLNWEPNTGENVRGMAITYRGV